ncbi:1747_t:CDS:2, partial [Funneliformis mosseae]
AAAKLSEVGWYRMRGEVVVLLSDLSSRCVSKASLPLGFRGINGEASLDASSCDEEILIYLPHSGFNN